MKKKININKFITKKLLTVSTIKFFFVILFFLFKKLNNNKTNLKKILKQKYKKLFLFYKVKNRFEKNYKEINFYNNKINLIIFKKYYILPQLLDKNIKKFKFLKSFIKKKNNFLISLIIKKKNYFICLGNSKKKILKKISSGQNKKDRSKRNKFYKLHLLIKLFLKILNIKQIKKINLKIIKSKKIKLYSIIKHFIFFFQKKKIKFDKILLKTKRCFGILKNKRLKRKKKRKFRKYYKKIYKKKPISGKQLFKIKFIKN